MNTGILSALFLLLTKVFFTTLVVGLIAGGIIFIKDRLFTEEEKAKIRLTFTGNFASNHKKTCDHCGKQLKGEWKVCPHCGQTVENKIIIESEYKNA